MAVLKADLSHQFWILPERRQVVHRRDEHRLAGGVVVDKAPEGDAAVGLKTPAKKVRNASEHFRVISGIRSQFRHNCPAVLVGSVEDDRKERRKEIWKQTGEALKFFTGAVGSDLVGVQHLLDKLEQLRHQLRGRTFVLRKGRPRFDGQAVRRPDAVVLAVIDGDVMEVFESPTLLQHELLEADRLEEEEQRALAVQDHAGHRLLYDRPKPEHL